MNEACSINLLESALAGSLAADDDVALQQHLDECESCSATLERMAGWEEWRKEATALLTEDELDELQPTGEDWAVDFTVEHLEPSNHPNALGRLGEFDVLEIIGQGGMGVVLKGYDGKLNRYVAIKVLSPHLAQNSLARKRFAREAQAAAAVVHPHVLAIHQVQPNGALPYLVMPLVSGDSLAGRLARQGTLELKETLRIGMQAAAGLAAAHEQGLVHRDVKPANILLEKGVERAVLTDFGLARAADDATLTRWGVIAGTPQYMSPEQARGEALDARSDLFSLGCVLYEMSTGVSPFRADSLVATVRRLVEEQPRAMESLNPELPPWFVAIVERLLEKDASRRYATAAEVSELLERCLAHVQQPANVPVPKELPHAKPTTAQTGWRSRWGRNGWGAIATAILLLGFGGAGALLLATAEPTDISGEWTGEGWDRVTLKRTGTAEYEGTYTDTIGKQPGKIELKWSRIERRYNGTWSEDKERFGKISVRETGEEIRGAWTTSRKANVNPGTPELADLLWMRVSIDASGKKSAPRVVFGDVRERTLNSIEHGWESMMQLDSGKIVATSEDIRTFEKAMPWMPAHDADIVACWDGGGRGLRIVGGLALSPEKWDASPEEVIESLQYAEQQLVEYERTIPGFQSPGKRGFNNLWAKDGQQPVYFIRTRKGTPGVLQIMRMTKDPLTVTFRYKLLMEPEHKSVRGMTPQDAFFNWATGRGQVSAPGVGADDGVGTKTATAGRGFVDFPTGKTSKDGVPISDAIAALNERAKKDPVGKEQPPLTEDELVGAVRWLAETEKDHLSAMNHELTKAIVEERRLPAGWRIEVLTTVDNPEGEKFRAWIIQLQKQSDDGKTLIQVIRQRLVCQLDAAGKPMALPEIKKGAANSDATPLAAAIHGFNQSHTSLCDIPQQPLTEEEVVAAIRWWKSKRDEAPVTNGEFAAFQKIADTREVPKGTEFELLPLFRPSDGTDFHIWSVRLRMPQESKPGWTYAYGIREQVVRADGSETKNAHTAWGPPAADGLQVGLLLKPWRERYASGEMVTPVFVYRNVGDAPIKATFPNLMTRGHYKKINVNAKGASIEHDEEPGWVVGYMQVELAPGLRFEVNGRPILLGDGKREKAETAIRVAAGESVALSFDVPHPVEGKQESLSTGELRFLVVGEAPKAGEARALRSGTPESETLVLGPTSNGVKIRLESPQLPLPSEGYPFKVEIRNEGGLDLTTIGLASIALDINGKRYRLRDWVHVDRSRPLPFGPGKSYTFVASLQDYGFATLDSADPPEGRFEVIAMLLDDRGGAAPAGSNEGAKVLAKSNSFICDIKYPDDELTRLALRHIRAERGKSDEPTKVQLRAALRSKVPEKGDNKQPPSLRGMQPFCVRCHVDSDWKKAGSQKTLDLRSPLRFGSVVELTVQDISTRRNCALDLSTNSRVAPPLNMKADQLSEWARKTGMDLVGGIVEKDAVAWNGTIRGLTTFNMFWIGPASFESSTPEDVAGVIEYYESQMQFKAESLRHLPLDVSENKPQAVYFRNHKGKIGVMEIMGFTKDSAGVKIRYKTVERKD